jgi:hypothetical protein
MKAWFLAVALLAPLGALAQDEAPPPPPPPPPPLPTEPYYPGYSGYSAAPADQHNLDGNVRVRLKSSVPGVHLVEQGNQRKMCWKNCDREFRVYSYGRYQLVDENMGNLVSDLVLPASATRLVLEYRGRITGLMVPGIVAIAMGGASLAIGLAVLALSGFFFLLGGSVSGLGYLPFYAIPFGIGGAVVLTGGIIMAVIGGKQRYEITEDAAAGPAPAPAGDVPPPPPPSPEPVPAIP